MASAPCSTMPAPFWSRTSGRCCMPDCARASHQVLTCSRPTTSCKPASRRGSCRALMPKRSRPGPAFWWVSLGDEVRVSHSVECFLETAEKFSLLSRCHPKQCGWHLDSKGIKRTCRRDYQSKSTHYNYTNTTSIILLRERNCKINSITQIWLPYNTLVGTNIVCVVYIQYLVDGNMWKAIENHLWG